MFCFVLFAGSGGFDSNAGGFQNSPADGGGASGSPNKADRNRNLTPVFIKQLEVDARCDGQSATLDGKPLRQIKIVGVIVEVKESSTNVQYTVEDSTGRINCKKWIDDNTDDPWRQKERDALKEGVYVKVFGQLREFQGHKNVNAFEVYPIVDFNEVTFHMLETLHVHLINTHGEKPVVISNTPSNTHLLPLGSVLYTCIVVITF